MDAGSHRMPVLELICPPQTEMLSLIRNVVATVARERGFSSDEVNLIESAVDEACTNVICHAYREVARPRGEMPQLSVQIRPASDHLAIRIIDEGIGLPSEGPRSISCLEEYTSQPEPKGLGLYIISQFMDEVVYDSPPGSGTVLSMVKYLRRPDSSQAKRYT